MERLQLPITAFIDPIGTNRHEIEALAQQVLTRLLTHLSYAGDRSALPSWKESPLPAEIEIANFASIPDLPVEAALLLDQLDQILAASMNAANPRYIGHMDSMPTTFSMFGDLIASAINNNMLSVEMSPVFSRLEPLLLKQFAAIFGLGESAGGVLLSGGTLANLQALAVARNIKFQALQKGIVGLDKQPVLFASEVAHTSLQKAAMLLGLGTDAVIRVPINQNSQMSIAALQEQIERAIDAGQEPFCVVATAGTTTTGNIDPINEIYQIAQAHQLWFHVDAAYGGALMFSPQYCQKLTGIENADSITFNPQKWLYVAKTCVMILFKHFSSLKTAFQIQAPYMKSAADLTNLGEISVQGTRHADVLKLWLSMQHLGRHSYAQLINESYRLTQFFVEEISKRSFLELASLPEMNIICFRGVPVHVAPEHWDNWNTKLQTYLGRTQNTFLSLPLYQGQRWLRAVLLNPYTDQTQILELFEAVDTFFSCNYKSGEHP
ncbi:aspartate aminotransferase family protein [Leptolyngbya sp. NK1-12]|uniref:Aspartate aminotransferase family protein n=2 Tax=Leptolyngbya sp. NK1-12 TaxID=2547451 RepID=A0AA96WK59_9CYAN|nr:aspartate aminotransferase family protein [Leptolyngbya sp. NK1-12]